MEAQTKLLEAQAANAEDAVTARAGLRLMGFSARETAGATADFTIYEGATVAAGFKRVPCRLLANETAREWYGPHGIAMPAGISVDYLSGTYDLMLYWGQG